MPAARNHVLFNYLFEELDVVDATTQTPYMCQARARYEVGVVYRSLAGDRFQPAEHDFEVVGLHVEDLKVWVLREDVQNGIISLEPGDVLDEQEATLQIKPRREHLQAVEQGFSEKLPGFEEAVERAFR